MYTRAVYRLSIPEENPQRSRESTISLVGERAERRIDSDLRTAPAVRSRPHPITITGVPRPRSGGGGEAAAASRFNVGLYRGAILISGVAGARERVTQRNVTTDPRTGESINKWTLMDPAGRDNPTALIRARARSRPSGEIRI